MAKNIKNNSLDVSFADDIKHIVASAREYSYRAANLMQVASNWLLGWRIVEQEQHGEHRAKYGKHIIEPTILSNISSAANSASIAC